MAARTQTSNSLDVAVVSATASTIEASGLGAYVGFHFAIVSSTNGAQGQMRYAYASAGRTDVLKVVPPFTIVPAVNDDLSVAKNQDNYNSDYGNDFKLVLKATEEWVVGATNHTQGDGTNHMVGGVTGQAFSQDNFWTVKNGSYMAMGYLFGETSLAGWYWNSSDQNATLGYQTIIVESSATFQAYNAILGTVYAHSFIFQVGSEITIYDTSFNNMMYDGARLKGNMYGKNVKFSGKGITNDYVVVASGIATYEGPIILADSYGFQSSATNETITINKYESVNAFQDIEAHNSTTWRFVNPSWSNPQILWTQTGGESIVSEIFTVDGVVAQTDGTAISSAVFVIAEGSTLVASATYRQISSTDGTINEEVITRIITSATGSSIYGPFVGRVWRYTYSPYEAALTIDSAQSLAIAMSDDSNIVESEASALLHTDVQIFGYATALTALAYASGTTPFVTSAIVSGATSGAEGTVREYLGDSTSGTVVLINRNGIAFTGNENLFVLGLRIAEASTTFNEDYSCEVYCNTNSLQVAYDYHMARFADTTAVVSSWVQTARARSTHLLESTGVSFYTEHVVSTGVWISKRGTGTLDYMTSDNGVQYIPPVQYSFELTGLKSDTEVRIYRVSDDGEITGTESSGTSFSYNYTYGGDIDIYVVVFHLQYRDIRLTGVTLSNANQSIPIQQSQDRVML